MSLSSTLLDAAMQRTARLPALIVLYLAGALALAFALLFALAMGLGAPWIVSVAQVDGDRGIAPIARSSDIDVTGIKVDEHGDSPQDAREKGWRAAQRKAWERLNGPGLPDSQLASMVSSVVIEKEQIGPRRYIATLGVVFDRARASRYLGGGTNHARSAPMLLIPVTVSGGSELVYERRNPWQRAWAEYQAGSSRVEYVRPSGSGGDSLLMTYGQTNRRSRSWWRNILDEFDAADVLVPIARLTYEYPGGPIHGKFLARHGPDGKVLGEFALTARNDAALPAMLKQAVARFDKMFEQGLDEGALKPDATLSVGLGEADPALQRLIDAGRAAQARDLATSAIQNDTAENAQTQPAAPQQAERAVASYNVQFSSPDAATMDMTLAAVRAAPGVRGAATSSLALGGTSVMSVSYAGSLDDLAAALRARGFTVNQGSNALAISR